MASQLQPDTLANALRQLDAVGDPVNAGGQKTVYQCFKDDNCYALKVIKLPAVTSEEDLGDREAVQQRAQREIDIMYAIESDYLVGPGPIALEAIHVDEEDYLCFSEEWIDGEDVASRVERGELLTQPECWDMATQILTAVGKLWEQRKLHRDISARNVMIRQDGRFVLIDLGYAFDFLAPSLTKHHGAPGTLQYMAPERFNLARKRFVDHRADQFSLGIVLYIGLTNCHPYFKSGMAADDYVDHVCNGTELPAAPSSHVPEISGPLDTLVMRLIARRPHLRYRDCETACRAIETYKEEAKS